MDAPGPSTVIPAREPSPTAVRPTGADANSTSLEADIRDAVGLGLNSEDNRTESTDQEGEFGGDS